MMELLLIPLALFVYVAICLSNRRTCNKTWEERQRELSFSHPIAVEERRVQAELDEKIAELQPIWEAEEERRQWLRKGNWGHDWNEKERKCWNCGIQRSELNSFGFDSPWKKLCAPEEEKAQLYRDIVKGERGLWEMGD